MADVDASIRIKIAENNLKVIANYTPPRINGKPLTEEEVLKKLEAEGVKSGIKTDVIQKMCVSEIPMPSVVIAEAIPPQYGEKARIEMYVNINQRSKAVERENGSVDFRNLGEITSATKGEKLYRKIPPTIGKAGIDVLGNVIPGLPGKDFKIVTGRGTAIAENDPHLVVATSEGEIQFIKGVIHITPVHEVRGDIDYETGNIKFKGSIRIGGTVRSGFMVEAEGDIEIRGNIEDAVVIGGNDIIIKGGFTGNGNGTVQAARDIYVKFVENQCLKAERDIIISGDSYHSRLYAGRSILAKSHKSTIVGGICEAKSSVEAARLGSVACAPTIIKVGIDPKLAERIKNVDEEITKTKESEEKLEKTIVFLYKLKIDGKGQLPPDKTELLEKLEITKKMFPEKFELLEKNRKKLLEEQKEVDKSYILANLEVFPKVQVHIGHQWLAIEDTLGPSHFKMINGDVARISK